MLFLEPIVYSILVLVAVAAFGLALGHLKVRGIGLGVAGVLFAGIFVAQFKPALDPTVLGFAREFGLILFVYMTGMHVGRGFLTSLRKQGWSLNLLSGAIILLGAIITALAVMVGGIDIAAAVGIFSGATTNTPSLGAAQEALKVMIGEDSSRLELPGLGYAVSYPFGVIGIILCILSLRIIFRIDPAGERRRLEEEQGDSKAIPERLNVCVTNGNLEGLRLADIPGLDGLGVVISRIKPADSDKTILAHPDTVLRRGDVLLAVGAKASLGQFQLIVGEKSSVDLTGIRGPLTLRRIVVTRRSILGKTIAELNFPEIYEVNVTRVSRADIEVSARPDLSLEFGDLLHIVGEESAINRVAGVLGNSIKDLGYTNLIPIFLGIAVGILIGMAPIHVPGLPSPVRLGLAGGPLLVAIVMSRLGRIGPMVCYVPPNANSALRELGIVMFLAAVGIKGGDHFFETLLHGDGLKWIAWGISVTALPLMLAGVFARVVLKMNFVPLAGLFAGSMTDPPALAFANSMAQSEAPAVAYATVYPITMLLRILAAQILVLALSR